MNYYPDPQGFDLREEMHNMLMGDYRSPGIARPVMIRRLLDQHCPACWNGLTGSPNPRCQYCQGEGYQFRETPARVYIAKNFGSVLSGVTPLQQQNQLNNLGFMDSSRALAYCEFNVFPDYERYMIPSHPAMDKLYELKVDDSGEAVLPHIRTAKWKIKSVTPHHGDFGRVEYFELGLDAENL